MNEKTLSTYDRKKYTYFAITNVCVYVYIRLYTLKKKKKNIDITNGLTNKAVLCDLSCTEVPEIERMTTRDKQT